MSESLWINELKERDEAKKKQDEVTILLRLHKAKVLAANMPLFWNEFLEHLELFQQAMETAFPDNRSRQFHLTRAGYRCEMRGNTASEHILQLELNIDGQCIDQVHKSSMQGIGATRSRIEVSADHDERLYVKVGSVQLTKAKELADCLVKAVCDIKLY